VRDGETSDHPSTKGVQRYAAAGVDLQAADETMRRIGAAVRSTYTPQVLAGIGAFGGLFALPDDVPSRSWSRRPTAWAPRRCSPRRSGASTPSAATSSTTA
jgi:hypothetical protein